MRAHTLNKTRWQRGDTIVEVLLAIAVASSVLAFTYATMNRNLVTTRASQERTEASKYAQSQLEALKVFTDTNGTTAATGNFCLKGAAISDRVVLGGAPNLSLDADDFSIYLNECTQQGIYHMGIVPQVGNLYRIYVRWERLGGGRNEVVMSYKVSN